MTDQIFEASAVLAAEEDIGKAGPVGLFLILSLLIVVFLLGRSMRTHLRRVPLEFPDKTSAPSDPPSAPVDGAVLEGEIVDGPNQRGATGQPRQRPDTPRPNPD